MRAVVITKPGTIEIRSVKKPVPGPYQALVRTEVAALCNATDAKLIAGHFPGMDTYPLVLGHEGAGVVEAIGEKVRTFKVGGRAIGGMLSDFGDPALACGWGGFCEYTLVHDHDAMVADGVADAAHGWFESCEIQRPLDADIPPAEGALLCTWREVYGGFGDFNLKANDRVLIFGAGPVGLSFVKFGKLLGLGWIGLVDPLPNKRGVALAMGADAVFAPDSAELDSLKGLDAVVDAVGSPKIINRALPLIKLGGSVCVYGVISAPEITLEKGKGPYNFNLIVHQWPTRSREHAAQKPLCDWIRQGKLSASEFVTHTFPIEKIGEALAAVSSGQAVKVLLTF
jgi:threonine dehydrogenase-like Zn-dependent dehydrogenase